tara:strand:+ start:999 stop:1619 length:621 start_codon:yes stop_codon:yes gene_type:complete
MRKRSIPCMRKRNAIIGALVLLLPIAQPLLIGTGAVFTSAGLMLAASEKAYAESAGFYFIRAYNKAEEGDFYGAISDYTKVIEINPRDEKAYNNRGYAKNALKDYQAAILDFNKAIEINPRSVDAFYNRARSHLFLGDNYGSISDNTRALEINPRLADAYLNRGIAKSNLGDKKGACNDYKKAISLGSKSTEEWLVTEGAAWCRNM